MPLHAQVSEFIISQIRSGELPVGSRLPGEGELMEKFGIARGTVRRAIRTLNESGYVQTVQGKGTFVLTGLPGRSIGQKLIGIGEALSYSEKSMKTSVLTLETTQGSEIEERRVAIEDDETILKLDRVRSLDGIPVARLRNWVRSDLAPGIENVDFESTSLFDALDQCAVRRVTSGERNFEAVIAPDDVAESLSLTPFFPLLFLRQITYLDDGTPIEWSDVWMDSRQISVTTMLSR